VSRLDQVFDYRTAAATVVWSAEHPLGFPSFPITFRFYPNRDAFEKALIDVGYDAAFARTPANAMRAVGGHRAVLLNERSFTALPWPDRVATLAHEMGHSLQYELGGGRRGASDQWLREGFADWLAISVLERLDDVSMPDIRRTRQNEVRAAGRSKVPRLADLVTFRQWVHAGERHGATMYSLSFVAVDLLIERHGVPALVGYFKRFAASDDRLGNFRDSFGEDVESFEAALMAGIWRR
jgi:hypothetical protein